MKKIKTKAEWLEANGFNSKGETFILVGNTYSIKNELKEKGWKFNRILKWHGGSPLNEYPQFPIITIKFEQIAEWDEQKGNLIYREDGHSFSTNIDQKNKEIEYFKEANSRTKFNSLLIDIDGLSPDRVFEKISNFVFNDRF